MPLKHVHFNPVVQAAYPISIPIFTRYLIKKEPINDEENVAKRDTSFQKKRIRMKFFLHLNPLRRKARRAAREKKRQVECPLNFPLKPTSIVKD